MRPISSAGRVQSIFPSARRSLGAYVARNSFWGTRVAVPFSMAWMAGSNTSGVIWASLSCREPPVSVPSSGVLIWAMMSPASSFLTICMMVIPVSESPDLMADWMQAAPRWRGSREAWALMQPMGAMSITSWLRICPYAMTAIRSGFSLLRLISASGVRRECGWSTGMPASLAMFLIAGAVSTWCLPTGRSGCVTRPTRSELRTRLRKAGMAMSPVPMKTMRMAESLP